MNNLLLPVLILAVGAACLAADGPSRLVPVGEAWAKNTVNANILRHNSVVSDDKHQYVAYYDPSGHVMLAKRELGSTEWQIRKTRYRGNVRDAHNTINIMLDGDGFLHMSWDHHGHRLRYVRSVAPGSLTLTDKMPMTGRHENRVTYPEFYRLPGGDLVFFYRDGGSGNGNLVMNRYDLDSKTWIQVHRRLIDGERKRSPYWQICTDRQGTIHMAWVWRSTGNVATNHDMAYARSTDGGKTWTRTDGTVYEMPITYDSAEYAARIPKKSELINTTGITADANGLPYIATYWRSTDSKVPQYRLVYHDGEDWQMSQIGRRTTPFSLSGRGSKRIPISRPHIVADASGDTTRAYMLFRDVERDSRVSVAICDDLSKPEWRFRDLTDFSVGQWEASYDTELWKRSKVLHVYVQRVGQGDGERLENVAPTTVYILEWKPDKQ